MKQASLFLVALILMSAFASGRHSGLAATTVSPPLSLCIDVNDDGVVDAADERARLDGQPIFLRWYEPVVGADGKTPDPHFAREDYSDTIVVDISRANRKGTLSVETDLPERIRLFADRACVTPLSGTWPLGEVSGSKLTFFVLAIPSDSAPQTLRRARLTLRYSLKSTSPADYETTVALKVSGTKFPNPDYFAAARHALVRSVALGRSPAVFGDLIFRDSVEPFHIAVVRPSDLRLRILDATGLASDPVNPWRPNPRVQVRSIAEAARACPRAVAIINRNYFHVTPMVPGTSIGMYPEGPLLEGGKEWTSDPRKWSGWWVPHHGALAQLRDGSFWYAEGATGWPANARSGVSALKVCNWDAAPHALIGVAAIATAEDRKSDELLVLLCGDFDRSPQGKINNSFNKDLRTTKESLGLTFLGALDGGGSNALAYRTPEGVLRVIPGSMSSIGRHRRGSESCINSYLVFEERTTTPQEQRESRLASPGQ